MEDVLIEKIGINKADPETLQLLPGVGPRLAEKILAARPFTSLEDMTRVNGIGPATIEDWRDQIDFSTELPEEEPVTSASDVLSLDPPEKVVLENLETPPVEITTAEPLPPQLQPEAEQELLTGTDSELEIEEAPETPEPTAMAEEKSPETTTRKQMLWYLIFGMVITFILATALSLGLLAGFNNGELRFASPAEVSALNTEVESINNRIVTQEQDLTALRERVDNLEALSDRVTAAENAILDLQDETSALSTQVTTLEENITVIQTDVEELQTQTQTFTTFFESMRDLFMQFFPTTDATE